MKSTLILSTLATFIISIAIVSCTKDKSVSNTCGVSNPIEELDWLEQSIDEIQNDEYAYYSMATYNGESVFFPGNCNPTVNYMSKVRNCAGDDLGHWFDLKDHLTDVKVIWKHNNSQCDF